MSWTHLAPVLVPLAAAACTGTRALDESTLAAAPPLPYRVAVFGGAFLPEAARLEAGVVPPPGPGVARIFSRTYPAGVAEPIPFDRVTTVLRRGRAATELLVPAFDAGVRETLVAGDPAARSAAMRAARQWAEAREADLMLVIEGLREGPVEDQGLTGQWPIATLAWLAVGIGLFIPDHRFEPKVRLRASIRDVHSGRIVAPNLVVFPGTMDLALVDRVGFFGIVQTVIVPPSLVANDPAAVVAEVREEGDRRLLLRLLARLKDPETLETIRQGLALRLELHPIGGRRVEVTVETAQEVQSVALQVIGRDQSPLPSDNWDRFRRGLLHSATARGGTVRYHERLGPLPAGVEVRVLVQTVAGQRTSSTIRIGR